MSEGKRIFRRNAQKVLRDMGMPRLDPAHGAAVEAVRWCLVVRSRPTHHRQAFLEHASPSLLAYLERLADSGDTSAWRTLEERIRSRTETLRQLDPPACPRPWLAAIWHALPELAALGQRILDRPKKSLLVPGAAPSVNGTAEGKDGDGKGNGSSGKGGSAGATAKPRPSSRLALPAVPVVLTPAERKALDVDDDTKETPDGPEGGPGGMGGPDEKGGPK